MFVSEIPGHLELPLLRTFDCLMGQQVLDRKETRFQSGVPSRPKLRLQGYLGSYFYRRLQMGLLSISYRSNEGDKPRAEICSNLQEFLVLLNGLDIPLNRLSLWCRTRTSLDREERRNWQWRLHM